MKPAADTRAPDQIEIARLTAELEHFTKSGIVEIAVRNPAVSEYMEHWEGRALKAEKALSALEQAEAGEPVVKALEWYDPGLGIEYADTAIGTYKVNQDGWWWRDDGSIEGKGGKPAAQADFDRRIRSALTRPTAPQGEAGSQAPVSGELDFATSIARVAKEEAEAGAAAGWRSCTGCHETNEGAETGWYPYSKTFGCFVGAGCTECGGIGVVWEYWSKDELDKHLNDDPATPVSEPAQPSGVAVKDALGKIGLWFFRELTDAQRLALFSIFGMPVHEIKSHGHQRLVLNRILAALIQPVETSPAPVVTDAMVNAEAQFTDWFVKNYPGPDTIIHKPTWHAPKIFRAARYALRAALSSAERGGV